PPRTRTTNASSPHTTARWRGGSRSTGSTASPSTRRDGTRWPRPPDPHGGMRIYLTGGSGLLGSHLAQRLRERGDDVVCLQRAGSDARFLKRIGCRILEGDVRDGADLLRPGMKDVEAVVHAAALVY